jgi:hypothetical protein
MGMQLYSISSIKLTNDSVVVENFKSDDIVAEVGDIINILGVDYKIESISGDVLTINKPYEYIGEILSDSIKLKKIPGYLKSQIKLYGELLLITVEDLSLDKFKSKGIDTPGWWYIYDRNVELLYPITTRDIITPEIKESKPPAKPQKNKEQKESV